MDNRDAFDLARFRSAQEGVFEVALSELRDGRKRSHWIWFVFPQLRGLGLSPTASFYGIGSLDEARAFLADPVLGPRLALATEAILGVAGRSLHDILGSPDDLKFRSSMTLFDVASEGRSDLFGRALERFCGREADGRTLELLGLRRA